jgi:hypothetical protein
MHASGLDFSYEAKCNSYDKVNPSCPASCKATIRRILSLATATGAWTAPSSTIAQFAYITAGKTHPGHEFALICDPEDDVVVNSDSDDEDYELVTPDMFFKEPENQRKKWQKSLSLR